MQSTLKPSVLEPSPISRAACQSNLLVIKNTLVKWLPFIACLGVLSLMFFAPDAMAQATGGAGGAGEKIEGFLKNIKAALTPISVLVVTIAFIFAGYQIAFNHKRISDVAPVVIGAIVIGAATQLAEWFIK